MKNQMNRGRNIFAISFLALFFCCTAGITMAACDPSAGYFCSPLDTGGTGTDSFADVLILVVQALVSLVGILAFFFVVVGGIRYIISAGNGDAMESAKHTITSALTGLILATIAYSLVIGLEAALKVKS